MKHKSTINSLSYDEMSKLTTYQAGVLEATVHRNLQKYCESVLKHYELSKMHWMLIGTVLEHDKGVRLTDLAKELGTTISYITVSVNLLTSRGILERIDSAHDSRSVLISIAKSYRKTCDEIELKLRESLRDTVYSRVNPEDLRTYVYVMTQLAAIDPDKSA